VDWVFAGGTPPVVQGDPLRLGQILINLLSNAVKFTASGQVRIEVDHRSAATDGLQLTFRVCDTGAGIPAETLGRLFTRFAQADASTTRSHGGTGLGLAISRQLAELMGGTITVESAVGRGSTFTCTMLSRAGAATGTPADQLLLAGTRIVVVHRRHLIVEAARRHLRSWGADVVTGSTADEALAHATPGPRVDLALLDATDDDAFARDATRLDDAHRRLPVVALTTLTARPAAEIRASLTAPIRRAALLEVISTALGRTGGPGT
jgi:CheY-like chemotaxis protein